MREGADVHDHWNYWLLLPIGIGLAAGRLLERTPIAADQHHAYVVAASPYDAPWVGYRERLPATALEGPDAIRAVAARAPGARVLLSCEDKRPWVRRACNSLAGATRYRMPRAAELAASLG